jgi:ATP/maltotriose-dependent transcriptional regulator MalT
MIATLFSYRACRRYFHLRISLLLLTALTLSVAVAWAQTFEPKLASSPARIARDMELIRIAEQERRPEAERGALWTQVALEYQNAADFLKAEDAYSKSLHLLKTAPSARAEYATTLECLEALYLIYGRLDDAESVGKQALAVRKKLGNPSGTGLSQMHLANIAIARHQYKKAERMALRGMEEMESSSKPPRVGMLTGFITITYARCLRGDCGEGLMSAQQAIAFANSNFEPESTPVGFALGALGFAEWKSGAVEDGEKAMLHSIQILRTNLAPTDPRLAGGLLQYHDYLIATTRRVEAQVIHAEVERMTSQSGTFCPACTVSVYSLSKTLQ